MTIHADFIKILKEGCSQAFVNELPAEATPTIAFIDGQVKLMKAEYIMSWSIFLQVQFYKTIEKAFASGAHTVVLGFDDYRYVPEAKNMTQIKRNKVVPVMEFDEYQSLPAVLPDNWSSAMRNRNFKVKVIQKVLHEVQKWFTNTQTNNVSWKHRTLVLDFCDTPTAYYNITKSGNSVVKFINSQEPEFWVGRGECDIKAFTWALPDEHLLIISTDGDFVPMSLLQIHANKHMQISLFRIKIQGCQTQKSGKRKDPESAVKNTRREYEFVQIIPLMRWLQTNIPSKNNTAIPQFCAMVAMCGCDFVMNLPRVGPRTMWKYRFKLQFLQLYEPQHVLCAINIIYFDMFVRKTGGPSLTPIGAQLMTDIDVETCLESYSQTHNRILNNNNVSTVIRTAVWPKQRVLAHGKNVFWTQGRGAAVCPSSQRDHSSARTESQ